MIHGATLDAAFVDALDAASKVSLALLLAAYVCLSRVKELQSLCVLQPISPLLFKQGPPPGPDRLIRKLEGRIILNKAPREWEQEEKTEERHRSRKQV